MKPRSVQHPCVTCGRPAWGQRCRRCYRDANASPGRRPGLSNSWAERKRRAACVREHRETFGDVCPGWGKPPHPATDLVADHVLPVAAGGDEQGPLQAMCRSCNARKRDRVHPPNGPQWAVQGASRAW